jgi:hypothetical protein
MLVLFDNGTPRTLARYLIAYHTVTEARAESPSWYWGKHAGALSDRMSRRFVAAVNAASPGSYTEVEIPFA